MRLDIVDDEGSFEFSPKAEFTSPLHVHFHFTLAIGTETESPLFAQLLKHQNHFQTFSNQMALKPVTAWNRMLRGHVNLVICLLYVKLIGSFFKFSFLIYLFKRFYLYFNFTGKTDLFFIYRYHYQVLNKRLKFL